MKKTRENFLRAGIVGCGHWARDAYLPNFIACDEVELRGLCDVDGGRARILADEYEAGRSARPQISYRLQADVRAGGPGSGSGSDPGPRASSH